jgi:hypothetical protein
MRGPSGPSITSKLAYPTPKAKRAALAVATMALVLSSNSYGSRPRGPISCQLGPPILRVSRRAAPNTVPAKASTLIVAGSPSCTFMTTSAPQSKSAGKVGNSFSVAQIKSTPTRRYDQSYLMTPQVLSQSASSEERASDELGHP